ncbi:MAG TPA: DUF3276 family protein, partial [Chitinophagaceae bacterium]|nr:DUF3276 family protein [Chitinophagaceae bacterium]
KVFLYKEDFNKFLNGLTEAINYVKTELMPDFDFDSFNHENYDKEDHPDSQEHQDHGEHHERGDHQVHSDTREPQDQGAPQDHNEEEGHTPEAGTPSEPEITPAPTPTSEDVDKW